MCLPIATPSLTIAKLVGILERREVIKAMRLLRAFEGPKRRTATNVSRGKLSLFAGTTLRETKCVFCNAA